MICFYSQNSSGTKCVGVFPTPTNSPALLSYSSGLILTIQSLCRPPRLRVQPTRLPPLQTPITSPGFFWPTGYKRGFPQSLLVQWFSTTDHRANENSYWYAPTYTWEVLSGSWYQGWLLQPNRPCLHMDSWDHQRSACCRENKANTKSNSLTLSWIFNLLVYPLNCLLAD